MRILLIHQHCPISGKNGGVETFIQDLLVYKPKYVELSIVTSSHVHEIYSEYTTCTSLVKKTWIPATLLTLRNMLFHTQYFKNSKIVVNRFEYVLLSKVINPRCSVEFFKHTIGRTNESKSSDSYWRYIPKVYRFLQNIAFKSSKNVWTFDRNDMVGGTKISWIPLRATTDIQLFSPSANKTLDVIWIGRLEAPKNPELASKILSKSQRLGFSSLIIGEGSQNYFLEEYIELGGTVKSFLPKSEISRVMGNSRILLMTSKFEAAPRVMIEALSSGCFVVCTKNSDPNGLIYLFSSRIFYFDSEDEAILIITKLKNRKFTEIDLSNFSNDKQFLSIWNEICKGDNNAS